MSRVSSPDSSRTGSRTNGRATTSQPPPDPPQRQIDRGSQGIGQEGPSFVLHGSVKGVPTWRKGPAVTRRTSMQADKMIMSRCHPRSRKELVIGSALDQKASTPQRGQVRPVSQRPQSGYVEQPGMRIQL